MSSEQMILSLMQSYVSSFNNHSLEGMLAVLHDEVIHDINEGEQQIGKEKFRVFKTHMDDCYKEQLKNVCYFTSGNRGAIEFICEGTYLKTDGTLPEAKGQQYAIPAAAFFEMKDEKLFRVTSYYSLKGWLAAIQR